MKKIVYLLITVLMILTVCIACDDAPKSPSQTEATVGASVTVAQTTDVPTDSTTDPDTTTAPSTGETTGPDSTTAPSTGETTAPDSTTAPSTGETTAPDSTTAPSTGETTAPDGPGVDTPPTHTYIDFTATEKKLFDKLVGHIIPFLPTNEYYVEEYNFDDQVGVNFYTFGNTKAEFDAFRALFADYTYDGTEKDDYGDAWYYYSKDDVFVDMTFYFYENEYVVDVYVYIIDENSDDDPTDTPDDNVYTDFTDAEKKLFDKLVGHIIPFLPTNEYYVEEYTFDDQVGINFYTFGNTKAEFDAFRALFADYTYDGTEKDDYGDAWYYYSKDDVFVDMTFYFYENEYVVDIYVYVTDENSDDDPTDTPDDNVYTDFTDAEKKLFDKLVGHIIPFLPTNEYYVEEYTFDDQVGVNFYTFGNTKAEFDAFRALFADYTYDGTEKDDYGDAWYYYSKDDVFVDMTFYFYENEYVVDVYVYIIDENSDDSGNTQDDATVITNEGKGLPQSTDGIYDVDFTKGTYVQDVTDHGYYIDGCPTVGTPAVLVIPIEFSDATAQSKGYTIANLEKIFNGASDDTYYYSVYDYFRISSYGQLELDITVLDHWFCPKNDSSYYENATYEYYGEMVPIGDQLILDEALAYLSTVMDLSEFDSDSNGVIDAVVLINTLDIGDDDFHWAYRYWNLYTDDEGYYYEYDGVSANDYNWISYEFMFEGYDDDGEVNYDPSNPLNPYTFIHEFGHVLGADDYYDPEYQKNPLGGYDIMDAMPGDHNPYTKFHYGWITSSRLIVTDSTVTVTLDAFSKNGDTVILANNWDETLGAYQEYYVIMYYTATELNTGEGGYFLRDGIIVYHVNSSLCAEEIDGETYYDVYYSNTSESEQDLIEFIRSQEGNYTYVEGDSLPAQTDDLGVPLGYTFTIDSLTEESATITFTKK